MISVLLLISDHNNLLNRPSYSEVDRVVDTKMCNWMCDYFRPYHKGTADTDDIYPLGGNEYRAVGTFKWSGFSTHTGKFRATVIHHGSGKVKAYKICITGWGDNREKEHCKTYN